MSDPVLRVVSGSPTPEELAVVAALVTAAAGAGVDPPRATDRHGGWSDPARQHHGALIAGPNGWRAAVVPN